MDLEILETETQVIGTTGIKLYDITPMDYFSKTQTPLSKSSVFRAELWRRRHRNTNGNGGENPSFGKYHTGSNGFLSQTPADSSTNVDIETVLTRNMSQDDLKKLIEHQMVEAMKLVRLYTHKADDGSSGGSFEDLVELSGLNETCASLDVSVRKTPEFSSAKRRRSKSCKTVKQRGHVRRITL